jgi:putative transposase
MVFHVLNRRVERLPLFKKDDDFNAFEDIIKKTLAHRPMRICAYCLMPNHWHFLLWPEKNEDLARFMQGLTNTHVQRWQRHYDSVGHGHVYQGRYKSFPVETDEYFYQVARYIERNPLRANLVDRATDWPWSSLWCRRSGSGSDKAMLSQWPLPRPRDWTKYVQSVETEGELVSLRRSVRRGQPFGSSVWVERTAKRLGLQSTTRRRGRPRKT